MSDATLVDKVQFKSIDRIFHYRFTIDNVVKNTEEDDITIPIQVAKGRILCLRMRCASTNFDFSLRQAVGQGAIGNGSIEELLSGSAVNILYDNHKVELYFLNYTDSALYLCIKNSAGIDTGVITLDTLISEM